MTMSAPTLCFQASKNIPEIISHIKSNYPPSPEFQLTTQATLTESDPLTNLYPQARF